MTDPTAIRARLQTQAAQDTMPISDSQARTLSNMFRRYYLTESVRLGGAHPLRHMTNMERHKILHYLTGTPHSHDLTFGWYMALFDYLAKMDAETTDELRAILAAAAAESEAAGDELMAAEGEQFKAEYERQMRGEL